MANLIRPILCLIFFSVFHTQIALSKENESYSIIETVPHDTSYFTQGLELFNGILFESGGLYGKSRIRKYHPDTDKALVEFSLADQYFAEGLTLLSDELFVLTWRKNTLFVLNPDNLKITRKLAYAGEGWGLANNGEELIMSNGSDTITFRDPTTFEVERKINVYSQQHSVRRINELEYAEGFIWANIWRSPFIVKINPNTGELVGFYDMQSLVEKHSSGSDERVLNGIAYDADKKAFWITGKLWPARYLIKFGKAQKSQ